MAETTQTKGSNLGSSVTGIAQAAGIIATTIASINDAGQRRSIEANLAILSEKEKIALANKMASQQGKNERASLLINTVLSARNAAADRDQKANTVKSVLIGSAGVVVLGILAWYLKKK